MRFQIPAATDTSVLEREALQVQIETTFLLKNGPLRKDAGLQWASGQKRITFQIDKKQKYHRSTLTFEYRAIVQSILKWLAHFVSCQLHFVSCQLLFKDYIFHIISYNFNPVSIKML